MKILLMLSKRCLFLLLIAASFLNAKEIVITDAKGESLLMEIGPEDTVYGIIEQVEELLSKQIPMDNIIIEGKIVRTDNPENNPLPHQPIMLDFFIADAGHNLEEVTMGKKKHHSRDYNARVTSDEKSNISYIVKTLGNKTLVKIAASKSSLEKAGDKVNHVHPLRFLMCIFTDEELKAAFYNVTQRGWVWKDFMKGLTDSLNEESKHNNLKNEYIIDFAKNVGIDPNLILAPIAEKRWNDLINILVTYIPRQGDPTRYDI